MARVGTIIVVLVAGLLFGWAVPLSRIFSAIQPISVALSIMIAAVFVRLNRGMPTLEWKSVDPDGRKKLTASVLELTKEYGAIIGVGAVALVGLVTLSAIGKEDAARWTFLVQRLVSGSLGAVVSLCVARMSYVVWRDIDVVRLQKHLIDGLGDKESLEREDALAGTKVADIRSAGVRRVEVPPPKAWGD